MNIEKVEKEVIFLSFKRNIVEILYRVANRRKGEARTPDMENFVAKINEF